MRSPEIGKSVISLFLTETNTGEEDKERQILFEPQNIAATEHEEL